MARGPDIQYNIATYVVRSIGISSLATTLSSGSQIQCSDDLHVLQLHNRLAHCLGVGEKWAWSSRIVVDAFRC